MKKLLFFIALAAFGQGFKFNPFTNNLDIVGGYTAPSGASYTVTSQTTLTVTAATHGQGTAPTAWCFDNASPALAVSCSYTVSSIGDVVFTWSPAFTGTVIIRGPGANAGAAGDVVGPASSTSGAVAFFSGTSGKIITQAPTGLFYDSANVRLGVGTASPGYAIHVTGSTPLISGLISANATDVTYHRISNGTGTLFVGQDRSAGGGIISGSPAHSGVISTVGAHTLVFGTNSTVRGGFITSTGNLTIGPSLSDGGYKLDVQNSGTTGTLRVYDQTAPTGSTLAVIQAGAGQSGDLLSLRNNAGTALNRFLSNGSQYIRVSTDQLAMYVGNGVAMGLSPLITWSSNTPDNSADLGLARNAAGVLEINSGTVGQYRDLQARQITGTTTANSTPVALLMSATGTGSDSTITARGSGTYLYLKSNLTPGYNGIYFSQNAGATQNWRIGNSGNARLSFQYGGAEDVFMTFETNGTLSLFNQTAVTGSTNFSIQAGAGQSGNLLSIRNNAGTEVAGIDATGSSVLAYIQTSVATPKLYVDKDTGFKAASDRVFGFSSTTNSQGTSDAGLKRAAAGYIAVTDGSTGLGKIVVSQSTPSASTDAGTAGAIWADATYIYVQTAAGTIKRVALSTF